MVPKRPGAMPRPCPAALAAFGVPAKRWETRADLLGLLEQARAFLDEAPNGTSIRHAALRANLSPYHFAHRFREAYGESPAAYHRTALMERAEKLLQTMNVSEVANELGYQSVSAFVRTFRRVHNLAPGQWKETQRIRIAVETDHVPSVPPSP